MKNKFDVIIIGAGPAGGSCARELAKSGHSILIIDKAEEIGEPNYSTAGTTPEIIKEFNIPNDLIYTTWKNIQSRGPNGKFINIKFGKIIGYSLKFRELKQFLIKEAVKYGAKTQIQTKATDLIKNKNKIIGVKTSGIEGKNNYYADIIVDASGIDGVFSSKLGLRKTEDTFVGVGFEQLVTNIKCPDLGNTVYIGFGSKEAPGGYAWLFPLSKNEAKIGIAWLSKLHKNKLDIKKYFNNFKNNFPGLENAEEIENHFHGAIMTNQGKMLKKYSLDNFICIGGSAAQINPLFGEGIRHFLRSGKMAAKVITKAIRMKDFSQNQLKKYDELWKDYASEQWKLCSFLHKFLYGSNDNVINAFVEILPQLKKNTILDLVWHYDKKAVNEAIAKLAVKKTNNIKNDFLRIFK